MNADPDKEKNMLAIESFHRRGEIPVLFPRLRQRKRAPFFSPCYRKRKRPSTPSSPGRILPSSAGVTDDAFRRRRHRRRRRRRRWDQQQNQRRNQKKRAEKQRRNDGAYKFEAAQSGRGEGGGATEQSDGRISNALPRVLSATTAAASSRQRRHRRRRSADSDRFATFSCPSQEAVSLERLPPAPVALNENTNPHRRRLFQCRRRRLNGSVLNLSDGFTQLIPRLWPVLGPGCRGTNSWMFTYVSLFVTCCFYHRFTFSLFSHVVTVVSRGIRVPTGIPTVDNLATVFWIRPMSLSST